MVNIRGLFVFSILVLFFSCGHIKKENNFTFIQNQEGVELLEGEKKVFFYQKAQVPVWENPSISKDALFNHYIHPLYNLSGDTITEAQPVNDIWHLHQRGIFWAWHQLFIGDSNVGDSWIMKDFRYDIIQIETKIEDSKAKLFLNVNWVSTKNDSNLIFVTENTVITVHSSSPTNRIIDFDISIKALIANVSIGGSNNQKGYGGFSARIKLPDNLIFTSIDGEIEPDKFQMKVGTWVDFTSYDSLSNSYKGLTIVRQDTINSIDTPWILRKENSMQNAVFPGQERFTLSVNNPLQLKYRLVIHEYKFELNRIN